MPDASGMRYRYTAGLTGDQGEAPLAYEPGIFGTERLALLANGRIVFMNESELSSAIAKGGK